MLTIFAYIASIAFLSLLTVQRACEVTLHPNNFHHLYEIPVINLFNQLRFPSPAIFRAPATYTPTRTVPEDRIIHEYPSIIANMTTGELPLGPAWYPAMHDPEPELLHIFQYYYQEHSPLVVATGFILAIICLVKYLTLSKVKYSFTEKHVKFIQDVMEKGMEEQRDALTKEIIDKLLSREELYAMVGVQSQAIFDHFKNSLPPTSSFATQNDINNTVVSSLEKFKVDFKNGELKSLIGEQINNLMTKDDSLALVGNQEVVDIVNDAIRELDCFILTREDATVLATAAADEVRNSLELRLDNIDVKLVEASSIHSAAYDVLAAASNRINDGTEALHCLSDKLTMLSEHVSDEITSIKFDTAQLSGDLETLSYRLNAEVATIRSETAKVQFQIEDQICAHEDKHTHLVGVARQDLDYRMASNEAELAHECELVRQQVVKVKGDVIADHSHLEEQGKDIGALQAQERLIDNRVRALENSLAAHDGTAEAIQKLIDQFPAFINEQDLKEINQSPDDLVKVVGCLFKGFMRQMGQMDTRLTAQIHGRKAAFDKIEDDSKRSPGSPGAISLFSGPQQSRPVYGSSTHFHTSEQPLAFPQRSSLVVSAGPGPQLAPYRPLPVLPIVHNKVLRSAESQDAARKALQVQPAKAEGSRQLASIEKQIDTIKGQIASKELVRQAVKEAPEQGSELCLAAEQDTCQDQSADLPDVIDTSDKLAALLLVTPDAGELTEAPVQGAASQADRVALDTTLPPDERKDGEKLDSGTQDSDDGDSNGSDNQASGGELKTPSGLPYVPQGHINWADTDSEDGEFFVPIAGSNDIADFIDKSAKEQVIDEAQSDKQSSGNSIEADYEPSHTPSEPKPTSNSDLETLAPPLVDPPEKSVTAPLAPLIAPTVHATTPPPATLSGLEASKFSTGSPAPKVLLAPASIPVAAASLSGSKYSTAPAAPSAPLTAALTPAPTGSQTPSIGLGKSKHSGGPPPARLGLSSLDIFGGTAATPSASTPDNASLDIFGDIFAPPSNNLPANTPQGPGQQATPATPITPANSGFQIRGRGGRGGGGRGDHGRGGGLGINPHAGGTPTVLGTPIAPGTPHDPSITPTDSGGGGARGGGRGRGRQRNRHQRNKRKSKEEIGGSDGGQQ
ncbi:hypothetical protein AOQ84DRAFT_376117 [Glonium stellatum]|uniref:Uncharacterized protein n=1 Tax=Glonium stellatum TaxID=574774 RepID=A0A8E2F2W3_9PEZI|nr:hypothetical protein AOQ84DRAFT_376117 [Glonium stellatum]